MTFALPGRILTGKASLVDTSTVISSSVSINLRFPGELRTSLTKKIQKTLVLLVSVHSYVIQVVSNSTYLNTFLFEITGLLTVLFQFCWKLLFKKISSVIDVLLLGSTAMSSLS